MSDISISEINFGGVCAELEPPIVVDREVAAQTIGHILAAARLAQQPGLLPGVRDALQESTAAMLNNELTTAAGRKPRPELFVARVIETALRGTDHRVVRASYSL